MTDQPEPDTCRPIDVDDENLPPDLLGQGLTAQEIRTMTDVTPTGSYL